MADFQNNSYPVNWVRLACQHIYGHVIADTTWRLWLRTCQVKPRTKDVSKQVAQWLMTLAFLKREKPLGGRGNQVRLIDCIALLKSKPHLVAQLDQEMRDAIYVEGLDGRQLPEFIYRATRRMVSVRTLYRWAKKHKVNFRVGRAIAPSDIDRLIAIARRTA